MYLVAVIIVAPCLEEVMKSVVVMEMVSDLLGFEKYIGYLIDELLQVNIFVHFILKCFQHCTFAQVGRTDVGRNWHIFLYYLGWRWGFGS